MPFPGELSALFTALLWSGSSLVFAAATVRVGSVTVNVTRLFLAAVYLVIVVLVFRIESPLTSRQLANLAVSGIIGLAIGDSFLFRAYQEMGPRITMLIMSLSPALTAILGYAFLGEEISPQGILGMGITIAGISVVVLERSPKASGAAPATLAGTMYALAGATGQAVNLLFAKAAFNEGPIDGFLATLIRILASIVVLVPAIILARRWKNPFRVFAGNREALGYTVAGSVLGPFLGIAFSLIAVAHTTVAVASTLMATVPILMLPMVRFVYRERLPLRAIAGAVVAFAGVGLLFLR
jgi:drug/metabolite transporter (DMT)-like permease